MRAFGWLMAAALGLGGAAALVNPGRAPAADVAADKVQKLIARLNSPLFRERETATRELDALGPAALEALTAAAAVGEPEARRRAAELIARITARQATARILAPTLVSLDFDRVPVADAVAELGRRAGAAVALHGDPRRFRDRTVTLTADKVTLWQAVRLLCNCAGLREWDGLTPLPGEIAGGSERGRQAILPGGGVQVLGQVLVRRGRVSAHTATTPAVRVALLDGPSPDLPTHHAGAVRIRALPRGTLFPASTTGRGDILLPLHVALEPRLNAQDVLELRIDRAVDDHGEARSTEPIVVQRDQDVEDFGRWNGRTAAPPPVKLPGPAAVRLKPGEWPAKTLRELAGVATIQAFAAEPVLTVARPAENVGQTATAAGGIALKLSALTRVGSGDVLMATELELPFGAQLANPVDWLTAAPGRNGGGFRPWGGLPGETDLSPVGGTDCQGVALEDDQGRRFAVQEGASEVIGLTAQGVMVRVTAVYRPPQRGATPARLVFAARLPALVEVPFVLRDVPLR